MANLTALVLTQSNKDNPFYYLKGKYQKKYRQIIPII